MATPILVTPGQTVAQGDWDALSAQHGNTSSVVPVPKTPQEKFAEKQQHPEWYDEQGNEYYPTYRYYFGDGSYVEARTAPNGQDYEIVQYKPSQRFVNEHPEIVGREAKPDATAAPPPTRPKPEDPTIYQTWDAKTGRWVDSGPIAQKPPDAAKPPTERVNPADPTRREQWDPTANGGKGGWVDAGPIAKDTKPATPPQERVDPADPTKRQRWDPDANDGKGAWVEAGSVYVKPDKEETADVNGVRMRVVRNPDGTIARYEPIPIAGAARLAEPPGAPPLDTSPGRAAANLAEYSAWLNQKVAAGELDPATATGLMSTRRALVEAAVSERTAAERTASDIYSGGITQRNQDVSMANSRLSAATTSNANALETALALNKLQGKRTDAGYRAYLDLQNKAYEYAQRYGGLRDIPREPLPGYLAPYAAPAGAAPPVVAAPAAPAAAAPSLPPPGTQGPPSLTGGPGAAPLSGAAEAAPAPPVTAPAGVGAPGMGVAGLRLPGAAGLPGGPQGAPMPGASGGLGRVADLPQIGALQPQQPPGGGNAFQQVEEMLARAGFSPEAIAEARMRFLAGALGGGQVAA